jgi:hypothetical protein
MSTSIVVYEEQAKGGLVKLKKWWNEKVQGSKLKWELRTLSSELSRNIELTKNHKAGGRKQGDRVFKALWKDSQNKIVIFCQRHNWTLEDIEMQVPGLTILSTMACDPESHEEKLNKVKAITKNVAIVLAIGVPILTAYAGAMSWIFHQVAGH